VPSLALCPQDSVQLVSDTCEVEEESGSPHSFIHPTRGEDWQGSSQLRACVPMGERQGQKTLWTNAHRSAQIQLTMDCERNGHGAVTENNSRRNRANMTVTVCHQDVTSRRG
jgi:hypothetical protein